MGKYVLEGEWSGYAASQRRVWHREVIGPVQAEQLRALRLIEFSDGTMLWITVRKLDAHAASPREMLQYPGLIRQAGRTGKEVVSVMELQR